MARTTELYDMLKGKLGEKESKPPHPKGWGIVKGNNFLFNPFIPALKSGAFWVGW